MTLLYSQLQIDNYSINDQYGIHENNHNGDSNDTNSSILKLAYQYASLGDYDASIGLLKEAKKSFPLVATQRA